MKPSAAALVLCALLLDGATAGAAPTAKATFAGGCFWCMEPPYDELAGVISTTSGYTGGRTKNPTYEEVSSGRSGHIEAIEIVYDPAKVSFEKLLQVFWPNIDPTDPSGQFCDKGSQYRSGIFYHDEAQKRLAEESKQNAAEGLKVAGPIVTEITPAAEFYAAEDYHQNYYEKNPIRYRLYRGGCGRDRRLEEVWGAAAAGH